jgi:hypothetical protein
MIPVNSTKLSSFAALKKNKKCSICTVSVPVSSVYSMLKVVWQSICFKIVTFFSYSEFCAIRNIL